MGFLRQKESEGVFELLSGSRDESMAAYRSVGARRVQERWLPGLAGEERKRGELALRTDDPEYLKYVDIFFTKIAEQADGYMHKDGGPVIGIQIENEYGHAGGPSDREEGMAHMHTLRAMAEEKGLTAPYYSATGWGGAYVPESFLPVLGGYVDAPWANHTHELAASENFLFQPFSR